MTGVSCEVCRVLESCHFRERGHGPCGSGAECCVKIGSVLAHEGRVQCLVTWIQVARFPAQDSHARCHE